ncbi:hypothetical protein EDB82DRAFT_481105 [Fusarium venenatum]|uniref:uncharacterized protein n=1 Tax=Fusarium venenatum TaxID=56646 RepID=UPI001DFD61D8|nr:hypothetical protein EDB82DRAFT_481105 [Fusarium venenatum]
MFLLILVPLIPAQLLFLVQVYLVPRRVYREDPGDPSYHQKPGSRYPAREHICSNNSTYPAGLTKIPLDHLNWGFLLPSRQQARGSSGLEHLEAGQAELKIMLAVYHAGSSYRQLTELFRLAINDHQAAHLFWARTQGQPKLKQDVGEELSLQGFCCGEIVILTPRLVYSGGDGYPGMCRPHAGTSNVRKKIRPGVGGFTGSP